MNNQNKPVKEARDSTWLKHNQDRAAELYPHSFGLGGAVGNEKQYSEYFSKDE